MTSTEVSPHRVNGRGRAHHLRRGDEMAKRTESERFWAKVDRSGGPDACWPWLGFVRPNGYGLAPAGRSTMQASRYAWIYANGPISAGLTIDHLCHNRDTTCAGRGEGCLHRRCCNPAHLEAVTQSVNTQRAATTRHRRAREPRPIAEVCLNGHDWTGANRYVAPNGVVRCMECARIARNKSQRRKARERAAAVSLGDGLHTDNEATKETT